MTLRVNGQLIAEEVILAELKRLMQFYSEHLPREELGRQMDALLKKAREQAIGAKLLMDEAQRLKLEVSAAEIDGRIQQMVRQSGGQAKFKALLDKQKLTMERLRRSIFNGRRIDLLIGRITAGIADPTDDEVRAYYQQHPAEFVAPERAQARHILAKPASASEQDKAASLSKLQELRRKISEGAEFADLAAAHSDCPSGRQAGGSLGWITRGITLPEFDHVLFQMEVGAISDVVQTPLGYHLIQKVAQEPGEQARFEDVVERIRDLLKHNARGAAISHHVAELRKKAVIEDDETNEPGSVLDELLNATSGN